MNYDLAAMISNSNSGLWSFTIFSLENSQCWAGTIQASTDLWRACYLSPYKEHGPWLRQLLLIQQQPWQRRKGFGTSLWAPSLTSVWEKARRKHLRHFWQHFWKIVWFLVTSNLLKMRNSYIHEEPVNWTVTCLAKMYELESFLNQNLRCFSSLLWWI